MTDPLPHPIEILLVEDNPGDIRLTQRAFEMRNVVNGLQVATDGVEALAYLNQDGEYADVDRPDLILLDLNLPRMDGREVLERIKSNPVLKRIPVVILTSSTAEEDIVRTYDLHANAYLTKPVDFDGLVDVADRIDDFWFGVVKYPEDR